MKKKKDTKKNKNSKKTFNLFKVIINWFVEEKNEIKRVTWPTRKVILKNFIATLFTVVFLGIIFYAIDFVMAWLKTVVI